MLIPRRAAREVDSDRARLRTFLAGFFGERHLGADGELIEAVVQDTAPLKVQLAAIVGFDEAVAPDGEQSCDSAMRWVHRSLHRAALAPRIVLKLTPGDSEGFADRHSGVPVLAVKLISFPVFRCPSVLCLAVEVGIVCDDDLAAGNGHIHANVKSPAGLVMLSGDCHQDTTADDGSEIRFECLRAPLDVRLEHFRGSDTTKGDRHGLLHASATANRRPGNSR